MDMENSSMLMAQFMKVIGDSLMELKWNMDKEFLKFLEIHPMDLGNKNIKDHGTKTKCRVMVCIIMLVEQFIMESGKIISIMEKEFTNLQMERFMKGNGKTIWCTVVDFLLMQAVENGKGNTKMVDSKQRSRNNFYMKNKLR